MRRARREETNADIKSLSRVAKRRSLGGQRRLLVGARRRREGFLAFAK